MFTPNQNNFVVCSSNFQSQQKKNCGMGEITADEILDMPIVFADEPPQEEIKPTVDNSSYFITNTNEHKMVVKEEPLDEDDEYEILCPTVSRTAIPERLNIKQVYIMYNIM